MIERFDTFLNIDMVQNLVAEAVGIVVTVLLVDRIIQWRQKTTGDLSGAQPINLANRRVPTLNASNAGPTAVYTESSLGRLPPPNQER